MSDDMGMAEEAMNDAIVESVGYDDVQASSGAGPIWTTIMSQRPATKLEYYKSHIGEVFECRIKE